jgi:outer membrane receptor protein involved in Fe transport
MSKYPSCRKWANCRRRLLRISFVFLLSPILQLAAETFSVQGTIRDPTGAMVPGAAVSLQSESFNARTFSDPNGRFAFVNVPRSMGTLTVQAKGYSNAELPYSSDGATSAHVDVVVRPSIAGEQVTVSGSGTELALSDAPGNTTIITAQDLKASPSLTMDDVLRQVPGFSLFRRTSSRVANPTTGGVSLRGLGASGASRALVLRDGVPLTDPFGGWVYWGRIPENAVSDVEVFRGGASNLYGSDALGGVIQVASREPEESSFSLQTSYGNQKTPDLSAWAGTKFGKLGLSAATDVFHTDGYILVPRDQGGTIDTVANSEHATAELGIDYGLSARSKFFANGNYFTEARDNGTPIQTNNTAIGQGSAGLDTHVGSSTVAFRMYGSGQSYDQTFSAIAPDRNSEALTNVQHVPAQQIGGSARWSYLLSGKHVLIAGMEAQEVVGSSHEQIFVSGTHTANSVAGGRQRSFAALGEGVFRIRKNWTVITGVRWDTWSNLDGSTIRVPLTATGIQTNTQFPDRSDGAASPRISVLRRLNQNFSVTASVYQAFRAPTLNELYRSFRVGNVVTQNNAQLRAEKLTGGEAGLNSSFANGKVTTRATLFWSEISDPIANATLSVTPALITRQRQNLGRTRSRGLELDGVFRPASNIAFSAGYAFTDATVLEFPNNPAIQGLAVPQIPRNVFTCEFRLGDPSKFMLAVQGRYIGRQYEDDQNTMVLDRFFVANLQAARALTQGVQVFAAVENVFNERYVVGLTPVPSLGPPILFRVGMKLDAAINRHK